jgi:hypothetical protein
LKRCVRGPQFCQIYLCLFQRDRYQSYATLLRAKLATLNSKSTTTKANQIVQSTSEHRAIVDMAPTKPPYPHTSPLAVHKNNNGDIDRHPVVSTRHALRVHIDNTDDNVKREQWTLGGVERSAQLSRGNRPTATDGRAVRGTHTHARM